MNARALCSSDFQINQENLFYFSGKKEQVIWQYVKCHPAYVSIHTHTLILTAPMMGALPNLAHFIHTPCTGGVH